MSILDVKLEFAFGNLPKEIHAFSALVNAGFVSYRIRAEPIGAVHPKGLTEI